MGVYSNLDKGNQSISVYSSINRFKFKFDEKTAFNMYVKHFLTCTLYIYHSFYYISLVCALTMALEPGGD